MRTHHIVGKSATGFYAHRDSIRTPRERYEWHVKSAHSGPDQVFTQDQCPACKELQRKIDAQ